MFERLVGAAAAVMTGPASVDAERAREVEVFASIMIGALYYQVSDGPLFMWGQLTYWLYAIVIQTTVQGGCVGSLLRSLRRKTSSLYTCGRGWVALSEQPVEFET